MSAADLMNYWSADDVKLMRIFEMTKPVIGAVPYDWMARAIDRALSGETLLARSARRAKPSS